MLQIKEVKSRKDLKAFVMLPFRLYKGDPNWVPPLIGDQMKFLDPRHNPFFQHSEASLYLAVRDARVVGRISAHTNTRHNLEHHDEVGFFGFFECEEDPEAAKALLNTALQWNRTRKRSAVRGPINFTINDECGMLVDGFDSPPMIMNRHDKPYYQHLLEGCGFVKAMDMYAYLSIRTEMPERIDRVAAMIEKRTGVKIRSLSKDKAMRAKDIETIFHIYSKAWEYNWGNVPMTQAELEHLASELLPLADPDMIFIAEMDGQPVGFSLAMPNYNEVLKVMNGRTHLWALIKAMIAKKRIGSARVVTMGLIEEYRKRGIDTLFYYYSYKHDIPKGYIRGEFSWVLENNVMMNRVAEMLDAERYKTYRIYEHAIN